MFVGNLQQWEAEKKFLPPYLVPWLDKLARLDLAELTVGRHELGGANYMNVDLTATKDAAACLMEAHRDYIDIQCVIKGEENIGWQPLFLAGDIVDDSKAANDAWFYNPPRQRDVLIHMLPGTYAIFTPADGHRCLCAPTGTGQAIKKVIFKIHVP